ncbi:MAG: hypothetical protein QME40_05530 [bacterium]|nr:hypothetical protein [bacterium]
MIERLREKIKEYLRDKKGIVTVYLSIVGGSMGAKRIFETDLEKKV